MKKKFNLFVFIFFIALVFVAYRQLFQSYFEADEWFHFTYYLPLLHDPNGFLTTLISTIADTNPLSRGQHIVPIGEEIFFLNTKFLGINFTPYAFLSLLLHSINSFLVFLFIKELFYPKKGQRTIIFALLGGIFFALSQVPMHAITWAAFYGQNVLSVTFFLLCILLFKIAFNTKKRKFIYASLLFLFLGLFTKETVVVLFLILPVMFMIEKRDLPADRQVFPLKFLGKVFAISLVVYLIFRFVIPNFNTLPGKIIDKFVEGYIPKSYTQPAKTVDTGTIVSTDLSIHKNLPAEILFRAITFPLKMTSELYFPRETVLSFMRVLTPIIYPLPSNISGDEEATKSQNYQFFMNGPGNDFIIYILSLIILLIVINRARQLLINKNFDEYKMLAIGLAIVLSSALPLVFIVLSFPRWGYDTYFDSRHYYMPSVGAAILFPFLLFAIGGFLSKIISRVLKFSIPSFLIISFLFLLWLVNNMNVFQSNLNVIVNLTGFPRKQIITQMKQYLPTLPSKTVFYVETDGLGAYGPQLPFQTSVPQVLTVVYYDKNPLPDSFFNKALFEGKSQGYAYLDRRGFGYYTSKKELAEALLENLFSVNDIYGFYYDSQKVKLKDTTQTTRKEMNDYLADAKNNVDWKNFQDPAIKFKFNYPPGIQINELPYGLEYPKLLKSITLSHPNFTGELKIINVALTLDMSEIAEIFRGVNKKPSMSENIISKKVFFDTFHYNNAIVVTGDAQNEYFIKLGDKLVYLKTQNNDKISKELIEKILGSVIIAM